MTDPRTPQFASIVNRIWQDMTLCGFRGSDPYDGLNSQLLAPVLKRSRLLRLAVIQSVKRSPVNLRPLLRVPPGLNPKGLALMSQGASTWPDLHADTAEKDWLVDALLSLASDRDGQPAMGSRDVRPGLAASIIDGTADWPEVVGWGYDFPWQSKAFLQPAFFPTVVATSFVVDAIDMSGSPVWPLVAASAGRFVAQTLHRHVDDDGICFSYSPGDRSRVYNASLFGARVLAQAAPLVPECRAEWTDLARDAVNWVMARQAADGSWIYGDADHWHWIDNLHTGFNLETIHRTAELLDEKGWDEQLALGLAFYRDNLFEADATPRYYTTTRWPLDPHSFAQGALTFLSLQAIDPQARDMAGRILDRGIAELWDEKKGGFRFQKHPSHSQNIIHMRWSQAWMFRALTAYLADA